jgi:transposase-like protein
MTKKRKHPKAEITALLAQADDLARQGKLQSEIARTLGVSVMTLHRWRKAVPEPGAGDERRKPKRSDATDSNCRASARKFTIAAVGDRSAPRKNENRRGKAGRALDEGWASHEATCQSRLAPFPRYCLPAARLRSLAKCVQRHYARTITTLAL